MAGSSGLAIQGHQSMRSSRTLLMFFLLMPIQIVTGNQGSIVGSCPCDWKLNDTPNPKLWQVLITNLQKYESCHNYIRFHLPRRTLCSSSKKAWVQKLRTCFDNQECGKQRTQDDIPTTGIQGPKPTELAHSPFTTTNPVSQTNQSSRTQPRGMRNRYLNDTTSAPLKNSSITNLKWEAEKEQMAHLGTPATIPVLCLLGIVFVLIGALAYVLCRKRVPVESSKQHTKGFELIIPCETNPPDSWM
ncbi:C-X-C motif chemokine 16 isoform X2 [Macrotis lagotis]|uniref:C-X-C motif chemokine 16 isoform X2 n=1 Tax=Macrotis lagotis TaxID=92651 RepID=UPI003D686F9B